jgi:hypothetical protein
MTGLGTDGKGDFVHTFLTAVVVDVILHVEDGIGFLVFGHATWAGEGHALVCQLMLFGRRGDIRESDSLLILGSLSPFGMRSSAWQERRVRLRGK